MVVVAVDTSGHVGNPPVWVVATRTSKKSGQRHRVFFLSDDKHSEYAGCTQNWVEKLSAALMFRTIVGLEQVPGIYFLGDAIQIDRDFEGKRRERVRGYLLRLFSREFPGQYPMNNPNILFNSVRESEHVKIADYKCTKARHGELDVSVSDPDLYQDLEVLPRSI